MKTFLRTAMIGSAGLALFSSSAMAAWSFSAADLVIGFQATGGQGQTTNLFFNLGDSYDFANKEGNYGLVGNINDDLTATYGSGWFSRTDLYFGVIANRSGLSPLTDPGTAGVSDPGRTFYVSAPTLSIGGAGARPNLNTAALASTASNYGGLRTNLAGFTETAFADGVSSLNQALQPTQWNNSWSLRNPTPGAGFGTLTGGIQQQFGAGGTESIVDIQRLTGGVDGVGVGSVTIGSDGNISAIPETSSSMLALAAGALLSFRRRRNRA